MPVTYVSGKNAKVTIGGTPFALPVKKWSVEYLVQDLDVTNTESAGHGTYIGGVDDANVTLEFDYDTAAASPYVTLLTPGALVTAVKIYTAAAGSFWTFAGLFIQSFENSAEVRGVVTCVVKGKASGGTTAPVT